jgi:hypothetical protein
MQGLTHIQLPLEFVELRLSHGALSHVPSGGPAGSKADITGAKRLHRFCSGPVNDCSTDSDD